MVKKRCRSRRLTRLAVVFTLLSIYEVACAVRLDAAKSRANKLKHGVSFEVAKRVFDDPLHLSVPDRHEHGEERWQTIGIVGSVVLLLVVHTYVEQDGEELIRIISGRKATRRERSRYEHER